MQMKISTDALDGSALSVLINLSLICFYVIRDTIGVNGSDKNLLKASWIIFFSDLLDKVMKTCVV